MTKPPPKLPPGLRRLPSGNVRWERMVEGRRMSGTARTVKDALAAQAQATTEAVRGTAIDPSTVTVAEYLAEWLEGKKAGRAKRTHEIQAGLLATHIAPGIGHKRLQKLTPAELRRFFSTLNHEREVAGKLRPPLGRSSQRLIHQMLHQALKDALEIELVSRNIAVFVKPQPPREREDEDVKAFTAEEAARFLEATRGDWWGPLFEFALSTGLRRGELVGLRWQDVNWEASTLSIRENVVRKTAAGEQVSTPKTRGSRRTVHLSPSSMALLRQVQERQAERQAAMIQPVRGHAAGYVRKRGWVDSGRVFTNTVGDTLAPDNLRREMLRLCEQAGVRPLPLHGLRHTYASLSLMRGVPAEVVSKQLGHSSVAFTLTLYRTVYRGEREAWALGIEDLISGGKK